MTTIDDSLLEKQNKPLSVLEMKQVKEGPVTGFGRVVAVGEQFQAVSRISAVCNCLVACACDTAPHEVHERPCRYKLHIDFTADGSKPPSPVIISPFDPGNGKPQVCPRCKGADDFEVKMDFRRAKLIRLQDVDNRMDNARQDVILYDDMVDNLQYNEVVQVEGNMYVQRKPGASKNSMMDTILHATSIKYLKRPDVIVTEEDIQLFHKWKQICLQAQAREIEVVERFKRQSKQYNCVACKQLARKITPMSIADRQAAVIALNIIGHLPARQGILRTIVGGTKRGPGRLKGKIQTLFIGDKGTAKSSIGDEGGKIHPNSAKVTATHATGKAVTGIVDSESKMLVLGVLPASDFVLLDEIDKLPHDEQGRLLGILEENHFGKDAYGLHY
jgi:DNA replicative helicase MCM subunit Mcm2 (Cdc46/Mcm family)